MTVAAEPHAEPEKNFSSALAELAAAQPAGASISTLFEALKGRGFGILASVLGLLLLIPINWVLPQIIGVLLLTTGWGMLLGASAPWLAFQGARAVSGSRLHAIAGFAQTRGGWLEAVIKPRFSELTGDFAERIAGVAILLAGLCALAPVPHAAVVLGLVMLGLGLMERDGIVTLLGLGICFAEGAYLLTMLAGAAAGRPFAADWADAHMPWLADFLRPQHKT